MIPWLLVEVPFVLIVLFAIRLKSVLVISEIPLLPSVPYVIMLFSKKVLLFDWTRLLIPEFEEVPLVVMVLLKIRLSLEVLT